MNLCIICGKEYDFESSLIDKCIVCQGDKKKWLKYFATTAKDGMIQPMIKRNTHILQPRKGG